MVPEDVAEDEHGALAGTQQLEGGHKRERDGLARLLAGFRAGRIVAQPFEEQVGAGFEPDHLAEPATGMPFRMHPLVFIRMWTTMMAAMMLPTIAPAVTRYVDRRRGRRIASAVAFGWAYLAVWALTGVVPLAVLIAFRHVALGTPWIDRTGGAVFVLAGVYQLTPRQQRCLQMCGTQLSSPATRDYGSGWVGPLRVGLSNGLGCLGSCWALMAVLLLVGVMNLAWMAVIAVVVVAEKNWRHGVDLTTSVGLTVVGLGIAVLVHPHLLGSVTFVHHGTMTSG